MLTQRIDTGLTTTHTGPGAGQAETMRKRCVHLASAPGNWAASRQRPFISVD